MNQAKAHPLLPHITRVNRPFWDGCAQGRLQLQRCSTCGRLRYPPAPCCPNCLATESAWEELSGQGTVFSFVIFHRSYHASWTDRVPYNVCLIELDQGPMLMSNVVDLDNAALTVGLRVKVTFSPLSKDVSLPVFKPLTDGQRHP
ncbi:MAG: Zn-ribbon domain-containing OB-fold protein [Steroidobacteraceae bacterium]